MPCDILSAALIRCIYVQFGVSFATQLKWCVSQMNNLPLLPDIVEFSVLKLLPNRPTYRLV